MRQEKQPSPAFTLYASGEDIALEASGAIRLGGVPRIGYVPDDGPTIHPDVDTIDATVLQTKFFGLGHSGYAEHAELLGDIGMLFAEGLWPPDQRTSNMKPKSDGEGRAFWSYEQ